MATRILGRNMAGIKHEALRKRIDEIVFVLHDELEDAYYTHWRNGVSHDWMGFDGSKGGVDAKALFDRLHGGLHHLYAIAFHALNQVDQAGGIPREEYDVHKADSDGNVTVWKSDFAKEWIADNFSNRDIKTFRDNIKPRWQQWIRDNLGHDVTLDA